VSGSESEVVVHDQPAWRDRADFVLFAAIDGEGTPKKWEQIWARSRGEHSYEICCIPFFVYDLALGDVVVVGPRDDKHFVISDVVEKSGRYVFRAWFGENHDRRAQEELIEFVSAQGLLVERRSAHLVAIDAASHAQAQMLGDFLEEREKAGRLSYETGRSGEQP